MPAFVDHPRPGVPFDPAEFWINGWLWLEERHDQLAAVEAWHDDTQLGSIAVAELFERPDVNAIYGLAPGTRTGFAFAAHYPNAPTQPFGLSFRGRLRDGSLTGPVITSEVTPPSPAHDPLGSLRRQLPPSARGLEIGAHARPVKGLTPFFTDAVASFAGSRGRVDFLSDALALPVPDDTLDYLCSSHVLEHLPNTLAALHEWHRVLRPNGWLYLVVPDKRYTFDAPRTVTPARHFLGDFLRGAAPADSAPHIDEFVYQTDWAKLRLDCPPTQRVTEQQKIHAEYLQQLRRGEPIDIHFHTFTPDSLKALLTAAGFLGGHRACFELVMTAERYPPDRIDGVAMLLRKRDGARASAAPATFTLAHADTSVPPMPLVCPLTLEPLQPAPARAGTRALVAARTGQRYPDQGVLPSLLPPAGARPQRAWSALAWRLPRHFVANLRLAFSPACP
jgi:SAM-dependent methyltransferase